MAADKCAFRVDSSGPRHHHRGASRPDRRLCAPSGPVIPVSMTQKPLAAMSNAGFVHLHVHSAYSLLKGSIKIAKLAELAKADRQPALALTDTDNMFGALEFSDKMAGYGIQPIIGCELAVDFGDQDPNARNALAAAPSRIVLLAARERGYRSLMRLNSRAFLETPIHQVAAHQVRMAGGRRRGPDRADRRPRRADFAGDRGRSCRARGHALRPAGEPVRRPALCRIAAPRHREGAPRRSRPDRSRLCQGLAAGRDQRAVFRDHRRLRSPRRAAVHRRRPADRRDRSRAAHPGSPLQDPRRNGRAVRRRAGGAGLHRRDCRALLVPPGHAQADPAALHGRRRRQRRRRGKRRGGGIAPSGRGGARQPHQGPRPFAGHHRGGLSRAACLRARCHHPHELCGLLPDRCRFHQMGEGRGHSGRTGPRLRRGLAGRLCADHHRSRSDPVRPAVRALSQSGARVDARLRHRLLPGRPRPGDPLRAGSATAAIRWRRSSPSARCRRAACCATSAACCRCPMARSTS